jgi:hypothetical protein
LILKLLEVKKYFDIPPTATMTCFPEEVFINAQAERYRVVYSKVLKDLVIS